MSDENIYLKRIKIAQSAVMDIRSKIKTPRSINEMVEMEKYAITYGAYGLLDYVKTGKVNRIMAPTIRDAVKKMIIKETEGP